MKLLLDVHYSPAIAEQLRKRGHDVVAAAGDDVLRRLSDHELLATAVAEQRALLTNDAADFVPLVQQAAEAGDRHYGLVLTSDRAFPRSTGAIGRLVGALEALLAAHPAVDALADATAWL